MKIDALHTLYTEDISFLLEAKKKRKKSAAPRAAETGIGRSYKATGMSQEKIAKKIGVHPSTVSRYKSDKKGIQRRPRFDTIKRLAAIGVRFPELR